MQPLRELMSERNKASIEGGEKAIATTMTDNYLQTDTSGYRQDKQTWLNE